MTTTTTTTQRVVSADGTTIAYSSCGSGPSLVLVDGALCHRAMGPATGLTKALKDRFTVYSYDRRGRGESEPGQSAWAIERELEDLDAVIGAAGGRAHVFGASSGAALALEAARRGAAIDRLVGYEAPFIVDATHPATDPDLPRALEALVDQGRRSEAVRRFLRLVGAPTPMVWAMRLTPVWRKLTAVAHTLPYDLSIVVPHGQGRPVPERYYTGVEQETLMIAGGKSPAYLRNAQGAVTAALPHGRVVTLAGQTHMIKAAAVGPVVTEHLLGDA